MRVARRAEPDAEESDDDAEGESDRIDERRVEAPQLADHGEQTAAVGDRDNRNHDQRHDHDARLQGVAQTDGQEAAQGGVGQHDQRGDQHPGGRAQAEARRESLSSSHELRRDVADHEDQDDRNHDRPQPAVAVAEARREEIRHGHAVMSLAEIPEPPRVVEEKEKLGHDIAGHRPDRARAD